MVSEQLRALVRRYPLIRYAARQVRVRMPRRLGGLDPAHVPPWTRGFTLALPQRTDAAGSGPDSLYFCVPGDLSVPRRLQDHGLAGYEPASLACFLAMLDHTSRGAFLDVGANIGVYAALAAARTRRRVFAFEPAPEVAAAARTLSSVNELGVNVVELALSNHSGRGRLLRSRTDDACNVLATTPCADLSQTTVAVDTLAHWQERACVFPSVLKIDTAGTEPDVISGGLEVLRRFRPWMLIRVRPGRGVEERLMALLEPLEYTWYPVSGDPPYTPRPEIGGRDVPAGPQMWMLAPGPAPEELWDSALMWRKAIEACAG